MQQRILPFLAVLFFYCYTPAYALPELKAVSIWGVKNLPTPYQPSDSFTYTYSNGRNNTVWLPEWSNSHSGFVTAPNTPTCTIQYDSSTHYTYGTAHTYDPFESIRQVFDASGRVIQVNTYRYDNLSASFLPYTKEFDTYNTDSTLAGALTVAYDKIGGTWDSFSRVIYTYAPGKLLTSKTRDDYNKSTSLWHLNSVDSMRYDGNSNLVSYRLFGTTGGWHEVWRQAYVYNSSNQLTSDTTKSTSPSGSANTYFYTSAGMVSVRVGFVVLSNGVCDTLSKITYSYDANQRMTGNIYSRFNKTTHLFDPDFGFTVTYTATGLVNDWTQTPASLANPIYQKFYYGAATGNVAAVKDANRMQLYPVPAIAYVNLEAELGAQQDISIMITDMTGRCVKQFKENAAGHYKKFIPLMELPAGTYTITLSGRETTSRQISVIH